MANQFAAMTKLARAQVSRRPIDSSLLSVTVNGGVVHMTGVLRKLRTHPNVSLDEEMKLISLALRQQPGIHEIVWEVTIRI